MVTKEGFASMDPERQKSISSAGGKAAHARGTAHAFTAEQAREAGKVGGRTTVERHGREHMAALGRKGGAIAARDRARMAEIGRRGGRAVSGDREHMAEIGRKGAAATHGVPVAEPSGEAT